MTDGQNRQNSGIIYFPKFNTAAQLDTKEQRFSSSKKSCSQFYDYTQKNISVLQFLNIMQTKEKKETPLFLNRM